MMHQRYLQLDILLLLLLLFVFHSLLVTIQAESGLKRVDRSCTVTGFALTLPTGVPTDDEYYLDVRYPTVPLDDGYQICSDRRYPRNIEVLTSGNCSSERINIRLDDASTGALVEKHVEREAPYYLYGNINDTIRGGGFLDPHTYTTGDLPVKTYSLRANPVANRKAGKTIQFDVVPCGFYIPRNECSNCATSGKVCVGGRCASTGYIRITLISYDYDFDDDALIITTPVAGGVFGAHQSPDWTIPAVDPAGSGGYVDLEYDYSFSCKSAGVWVKNIVFPTKELAPAGTYMIDVQSVDLCGFQQSQRNYVLKIYVNNVLLANYTYKDGNKFNFTI